MSVIHYFKFQRSEKRYYVLDALRTLAVLLVVFRHGVIPLPLSQILNSGQGTPVMGIIYFLSSIGWTGVDLFFVLSGFLIGSQLLGFFESRQPLKNIWRFYANRAFRIFPAYFAVLLLLQFVLPHWAKYTDMILYQNIPAMMLNHYFFLQDYTGSYIYAVLWSLAVEEKFYIIAPFFLLGLYWLRTKEKLGNVPLLFFTFLMSIPILGRLAYYLSTPETVDILYRNFRFSQLHARCDGLIVGIIIAYLVKYCSGNEWMKNPKTPYILLGGGSVALLFIMMMLPGDNGKHFLLSDLLFSTTMVSLAYGAMVLGGVLLANEKAGLLGNRLFYFLATVSYSLYLTHYALYQVVMTNWLPLTNSWNWPADAQIITYLILYTFFSIAVATVFYWTIEKPFLILKEKLLFTFNSKS